MKLIVAGVGPGDSGMVTAGALRALDEADLVLIPHARDGSSSVAGTVVGAHLPVWPSAVPLLP